MECRQVNSPIVSAPLTPRQAALATGLSLPSFWRAVADGRLPQPLYPSPRCPRWFETEIRAAMELTRTKPSEAMARRRAARLDDQAA